MTITSILTVWKRNNLKEQLEMINNQTIKSDIIVFQNENHVNIEALKKKYNFTHIHSRDFNYKFHGRFLLPLLLSTDYVCIFDDDCICNPRWFARTMKSCAEKNAIIGGNGRLIKRKTLTQTGPHGDDQYARRRTDDVLVDFVGHCWFFKRDWIHYMWQDNTFSVDNGEDIHLCAAAKVFGGIDSYVGGSADWEEKGDLAQARLGSDQYANWKKNANHRPLRIKIIRHWIKKGWKPLAWRKK